MNPRLNRTLVFLHRWLGIVLAVIVVLWFASGIVTMYVGYPKLTRVERLSALPVLSAQACCIPLADAWRELPRGSNPKAVTLTSIANRPVYRFELEEGFLVVDALAAVAHKKVTRRSAMDSAQAYTRADKVDHLGIVDEDVWTRSSRLHAHRPLHRVLAGDPENTLLYISSQTGEVVLDATRSERFWYYLGPWIHWLHMFRGFHNGYRILIIAVSLLGLGLSLMGVWLGLDRWRFKGHYANGRKTPYRGSFMRWHHVTGLLFGLLTITWTFSGMTSINPWGVFGTTPSLDVTAFMGSELAPGQFQLDSRQALARLPVGFGARELEWHLVGGEPYFVARNGRNETQMVEGRADVASRNRFTSAELRKSAASLVPGATMQRAEELSTHDKYYYARDTHTLRGDHDRSLPVLRVIFDDPSKTWAYISPYTGTVIMTVSFRQRVERWMFFMLHSWDIRALIAARPLWDVILIIFSIGGLVTAITGTVIGVRRLRLKAGGQRT